ncbi:MAG: hypothetical protein P4L42_09730 [Desulfocapsaceae bacterium]|nr:hypothetical protein [Desulfocapsaceae bacterium]
MVFRNFRKSGMCFLALLIAAPLLCGCFIQPEKTRPTDPQTVSSILREPEGYSSDGPQAVIKPTDPATRDYPAPQETRKSTDPETITSRTH